MSSIESLIFDALKTIVSSRVFPDIAPLTTTKPYITYTQIGGEPFSHLANTVPDKQNGRFQFNAWGDSRTVCSALMAQIETALVTSTAFQARPVGAPTSTYDYDMNLYGSLCDFSIWSSR